MIRINLSGPFLCTRALLPDMLAAGWGRIINISSSSAQTGAHKMAHYVASKGGVIGFTKALAIELAAKGITVNNICPGFTKVESWGPRADAMAKVRGITPDQVRAGIANQTLLGRWAEPDEIGNAAAFLVSEKNSYMTGTTVEVDGGFTRYI